MENLQKVMDILYSKAECFSNEEYLTLMNELLAVSKIVREHKAQEPEPAERNEPIVITPPAILRRQRRLAVREYTRLTAQEYEDLYSYSDPIPHVEDYVFDQVYFQIQRLLYNIEISRGRESFMKLSFCIYAYMFRNYKFILDHHVFKITITRKLENIMNDENNTDMLMRLGKYDLMNRWLTALRT